LPTLEKLHNKHHFLLLLFPEKPLRRAEDESPPCCSSERALARSLAPPNDGARETRNKQTRLLARSPALPRARATWRRLPPPPLQPCRPATIQSTVTAAGFSVVNWTVVKWILL
jgi:hypothetical protein